MELWFHKKAFWNFLLLVRAAAWEEASVCVLAERGRNREARRCEQLKDNLEGVKWYFPNLRNFCLGSFQIRGKESWGWFSWTQGGLCPLYVGSYASPSFTRQAWSSIRWLFEIVSLSLSPYKNPSTCYNSRSFRILTGPPVSMSKRTRVVQLYCWSQGVTDSTFYTFLSQSTHWSSMS